MSIDKVLSELGMSSNDAAGSSPTDNAVVFVSLGQLLYFLSNGLAEVPVHG